MGTSKRDHGETCCDLVHHALSQIDRTVRALERCEGKLAPVEYTALRARLGHLMDTLYRVGSSACEST